MTTYLFGRFKLELATFELTREGEAIEIGPKALDLLTYLIQNRDRTITKAELIENVWGASAMSASTVPTCIAAVRKALSDSSEAPRFLTTTRGRGYRFIAEVTQTSEGMYDQPYPEPTRSIFVGRERELSQLQDAFSQALEGQPTVVVLTGEPGIGKTRTAHEFLRRIPMGRARRTLARCQEAEGAPPFWPWIQAIRVLFSASENRIPPEGLSTISQKLAPMIPELDDESGKLSATPVLDSPKERFRLFDSVTTFLRIVSQNEALVLMFDDLHRADIASLQLLRFAMDELQDSSVFIVGTSRSHNLDQPEDLCNQLRSIFGQPWAKCVPLMPLTVDDVSRYVEEATRHVTLNRDAILTLAERSGGNPLFLSQLVALLPRDGTTIDLDEASGLVLPRGLRESTKRHLEGLPIESEYALKVCAVIGREFDMRLLADVLEKPLNDVAVHLEPAMDKGLLARSPSFAGALRFTHILVRDTLYEEIPMSERMQIHCQVAIALERLHRLDAAPHAAELAHHFSSAGDEESLAKAVVFASLAAEWCTSRLAHEDAARHLRSGLRALELCSGADPELRCALLIRLGEAELRSEAQGQGRANLREAFAVAESLALPELQARAALTLAPGFFATDVGVFDPLVIGMLEQALDALPDKPSPLRAQLAARLSIALAYGNADERRQSLSADALRIARLGHDAEARAYALSARHGVLWDAQHSDERNAVINELGETAVSLENPEFALIFRLFRLTYLLEQGNVADADREIMSFSRISHELELPHFLWQVQLLTAMRLLMEGRFDEAEPISHESFVLGQRAQADNAIQSCGTQLLIRRWEQGRVGELIPMMEGLSTRYPPVLGWSSALAFFCAELERLGDARRHLRHIRQLGLGSLPRNETWRITIALLGESAASLDDVNLSEEIYPLLLPLRDSYCVIALGVAFWGSYARALGRLAAVLGKWDIAEEHFAHALTQDSRVGAPPFVAHDHYHYARMLRKRGADGDADAAQVHLSAALDIARSLDMRNLERRLIAELK